MGPPSAFMMQEMNRAPSAGQWPLGAETEAEAEEPRTFERFFRDEAARLFRALYLMTGHTDEAEDIIVQILRPHGPQHIRLEHMVRNVKRDIEQNKQANVESNQHASDVNG